MKKEFTGIVLSKNLSGESGLLFKIFSRADGLIGVHKRVSSKKTTQVPDFFDEIAGEAANAKSGDLLFLEDFTILKKRTPLGANYESFCAASDIAKFLIKNARYLEHAQPVYETTTASLDALEAGAASDVVKFKFLYVFARDEGYPVKESFARSLDDEEFAALSALLKTPSLQCEVAPEQVSLLLSQLEQWIYSHTDILPS